MNFESAVAFLKGFHAYEDKGFPKYNEQNFGVKRVKKFLKEYGVDYGRLKYLHVAGSKGKSSVCGILANYLKASGYKTGLFITPNILDIRECFWLDGESISVGKFVKMVEDLKKFIEKKGRGGLTYFELLTVLVFKYFVEMKVDFAVIEVALGGRLDATNVIMPEVAVLTTVEKEHTEILGKTFDKILNEKLGIVVGKKNVPLVVGYQNRFVKNLINQRIKSGDLGRRKVVFVGDQFDLENVNLKNMNVAERALELLLGKINENLLEKVVDEFRLMGRFDERTVNGKMVVFDMAHTKNSILALMEFLKSKNRGKGKFWFLVSIMKGKDVENILKPLSEVGKKIVVTSSNLERGYLSEELREKAARLGFRVVAVEDCRAAFDQLQKEMGKSDILVVTGSHFLIGKLLKSL